MKITVDLPETELAEICEITGISKEGPAIRRLLVDTSPSPASPNSASSTFRATCRK
jgi:hypothetical protein